MNEHQKTPEVIVARSDLRALLMVSVFLAGAAAAVVSEALGDSLPPYLSPVLAVVLTGILLVPTYRVWKQSRGRPEPPLGGILMGIVQGAVVAAILAWGWAFVTR